jgi:hypothetical protein
VQQTKRPGKNRARYSKKIAATAGAVTGALLAPGAANAAVIHVTGAPVSLSLGAGLGASAAWDVDGVGGADFELFVADIGTLAIHMGSTNGYGLVAPFPTDNVQALFESFNVGPTLASGFVWGSGPGYRYRNALVASGSGFAIGYDFNYGFAEGPNFFGFRFGPNVGNRQYGWGVINFDTTNGVVTISEWAYETALNPPIPIASDAAVAPEPSSLALLATGAAGLLFWRRRRKDADAA